jgi:hypothetical protein
MDVWKVAEDEGCRENRWKRALDYLQNHRNQLDNARQARLQSESAKGYNLVMPDYLEIGRCRLLGAGEM